MIAGDGPDRERLEALASRHGLDGRVRFAGRVSTPSSPTSTRRCLAVYYAPVDEDYGMVPYEAFLSEKPVVTTSDAGGPLDVVVDRRTGLVVEPHVAELAAACRCLASTRTTRAPGARPGRPSPSRSPGTTRSSGCSREGRLLLARCRRRPPASPTTARCCCRRCASGSTSRSSSTAGRSRRGTPTSRSTTSATARGPRLDRRGAAPRGRASSSCTSSSCTTSSPG